METATTTTRPPTRTQFVRFLNDNPPVDHPIYRSYVKNGPRFVRYNVLPASRFGEHLYTTHMGAFNELWAELMQQPEKWGTVKEGR
jgi:hypothetical protein